MMISEIKWPIRQRLEFIEVSAYYTGFISRKNLANVFAISDAAATKDLKLYGDIAPNNLYYKHSVFGFVPSKDFKAVFSDLDPSAIMTMLAYNLTGKSRKGLNKPVYGIPTENLFFLNRLPEKEILCQITRAIYTKNKLEVIYYSMLDKKKTERIIEPHSLMNTGSRWYARAYDENDFNFRDFILSRFIKASCLDDRAQSSSDYDEDWVERITLKLAPHPNLSQLQKESLLVDFHAQGNVVQVSVRRALIGHLLQQLCVDTSQSRTRDPKKYPFVIINGDEIEPFASRVFDVL